MSATEPLITTSPVTGRGRPAQTRPGNSPKRVTQALMRALQTQPRSPATIDGPRQRTWTEFGDRVARQAAILQRMGLERGGRVAVLSLNSDCFLELLVSVAWAGGVVVPMNTRWVAAEIGAALKDCAADILLVDDAFVPVATEIGKRVDGLRLGYLGHEAPPPGMIALELEIAGTAPVPDACGSDDEIWAIVYTGGTTGHAKGVMLSHGNIVTAALVWNATLHFTAATRYLHVVGFFHMAGLQQAIALIMAGGLHVVAAKFEPKQTLETIETYGINFCLFVPTMLAMLMHHPDLTRHDLTSVKDCMYGGSAISDAVLELGLQRLPGWRLVQGYGQTEATGLATTLDWDSHFGEGTANKRRCTGRVAHGVELRIVDPAGHEVPRGTVGEVAVRGPTVMLGYWNQPDMTAEVIRGDWLHTGDAASMDEDGFIKIVDRYKDMIVSGGENVFSREVENAVSTHPAVRDCAVIGVPHPVWGEAVHAAVVLNDGATLSLDELAVHCRPSLAGFKHPRSMEVRASMPISAAGKISKNILRSEYRVDRAG